MKKKRAYVSYSCSVSVWERHRHGCLELEQLGSSHKVGPVHVTCRRRLGEGE